MEMKVYLDNNATTPVFPEVKEEMEKAAGIYGNPSSLYNLGIMAQDALRYARERVASSIGCETDEIIFTSGGTESNNIAVQGYLRTSDKKHIITSKTEHPAVLNIFKYLENTGYDVSWIDVDKYGMVDAEEIAGVLRKDTALVSIMMANNEVGTVQCVKEIVRKVKDFSSDIVFHTDAVQALGKMKFNVNKPKIDLLSVSSHKINGPKGVGALYIRNGLKMKSVFFGGHHEKGLRPGTENVQGIIGFGKAAELAYENLDEKIKKLKELKEKLKNGIEENIKNIKINGHTVNVLPNTLNVSFKNIEGESIVMMLDMEGISVSTGSACSTGTLESSHVLVNMGLEPVTAQSSVRFSIGEHNTTGEIDYVIKKLPFVIEKLRKISPIRA